MQLTEKQHEIAMVIIQNPRYVNSGGTLRPVASVRNVSFTYVVN